MNGHFGEILQGRMGPDGPVALVTLPCPRFAMQAEWTPDPTLGEPCVAGPGAECARAALNVAQARFGWPLSGRLRLSTDAPPGGGAGTSTLAALSAIRTLARSSDRTLSAEEEAMLCLAAEGASDPLMFEPPDGRLWASREGRTLAHLPPGPIWRVVGGFDGPVRRTDPADHDFADIRDLVAPLSSALSRGDRAEIGRIATRSAARNQERRPKPNWAPIRELAESAAAAGVAVAHTGSAIGLLFDPDRPQSRDLQPRLRALGLSGVFESLTAPLNPRPAAPAP